MPEPSTAPRPRQVTFAGVTAVAGCALLVIGLFDAMALVRSAEMRTDVASFLSRPPGDGLGLGVDRALGLLRGAVLLGGALAAAGAILGVYVLQRHRGARVGLSVVAGLLLLLSTTQLVGVLPAVVAASATLLWTPEARAWFDGRPYQPAKAAPGARDPGPRGPGSQDLVPPPVPTAPVPPAASPVQPHWAPPVVDSGPTGPSTPGAPADASPETPVPSRRPRPVTVAGVLTLVASGLTALLLASSLVYALADKQAVYDVLRTSDPAGRLGGSPNEVLSMVLVVQVVAILWCLAAAGLAIAALHRTDWARILLVVSAVLTALLSLVLLVGAGAAALPLPAGAVAVAVLLLTPAANRWYAPRPPAPLAPARPTPPAPGPVAWPEQQAPQPGPQHAQHAPQPGPAQAPQPGPQQNPQQGPPSGKRGKPPVW